MSFFFMLFPLTLQIAPELISIAGDTRTYTALRQWDRTRRPVCGHGARNASAHVRAAVAIAHCAEHRRTRRKARAAAG